MMLAEVALDAAAPWHSHGPIGGKTGGKTIGKPWENHRKMVVSWDLMGFYGSFTLWS